MQKIKIYDENANLRITFDWPQNVGEVYIATAPPPEMGRLFTLQEYKGQGGFVTPKLPGVTTYYIYPTDWGEVGQISYTFRTDIDVQIREKIGRYKNHHITLCATHPVPQDVVCYVKDDGTRYQLGESLQPNVPLTRVVRTCMHEYLRLFIAEDYSNLYSLRG